MIRSGTNWLKEMVQSALVASAATGKAIRQIVMFA
jgi:hypothetical protein